MFSAHSLIYIYIYALLTKREVKMAGYRPSSFFAFLLTETKPRSIKTFSPRTTRKSKKKFHCTITRD